MSEGRQIALLLVGALVLTTIGIVAATAFPEPCEEVEGIGRLELEVEGAAAALGAPAAEAAAVEALGERLGIGRWLGAVRLPDDARVLPSDFGFFAVTDSDLVALRPGSGIASAPRDVTGLDVVGVGGTSVGLVTPDRTIAVVSSAYERERCGRLPDDGRVLAIDRGFVVVATEDTGAALWTLSGDDVADLDLTTPVVGALVRDDRVVVATTDRVEARALPGGAPAGEVAVDGARPLAGGGDALLLVEQDRPDTVVVVEVADDGSLTDERVEVGEAVTDAVATPAGVVVATRAGLATDRAGEQSLPVAVEQLVASEDGTVGVVTDGRDGPVLLMWGRDQPRVDG